MSGRTRAGEERIHLYKRRGVGVEERRKQLAAERRERRTERRTAAFTAHRGLVEEPAVNSRQHKLEEWRKKKMVGSKTSKPKDEMKRPAFVCGKITYNDTYLYKTHESQVFRPPKGIVPVQESQPIRRGLRSQTRNQEKESAQCVKDAINIFTAAMASAHKKQNKMPQTPKNNAGSIQRAKKTSANVSAAKGPAAKTPAKGYIAKTPAKSSVAKTPAKSSVAKTPAKSSVAKTPAKSSVAKTPAKSFVTKTPAKSSVAKTPAKVQRTPEIFKKPLMIIDPASQKISEEMFEGNLKQQEPRRKLIKDDQIPVAVTNTDSTELKRSEEILIQKDVHCAEEKSAQYFRSLYNGSVTKLNRLCNEWTNLEIEVPDEIGDDINVAVGYAKLLISQKLQQFEDLISEHENTNCSTDLKVLINDLDGFWSMVNNQVEDVYRKFERLETLKGNNWQDTSGNFKEVKPLAQKSKILKTKGNVTSGLRSFLTKVRKQARIGSDENKPAISFGDVEMHRPMSPVVMRIASRAKQLGSPKISYFSNASRSPLSMIQPKRDEKLESSPEKSTQKTPAEKKTLRKTPGSTPLRRSTRINARAFEAI